MTQKKFQNSPNFSLAIDSYIRREPKFKVFSSSIDQQESEKKRSILTLAIEKANEALSNIHTNDFYGRALQAFEQFASCDSYPVFVELLTKRKEQCSNQDQIKKLGNAFILLDAHVYAKIGDIE